MGIFDIFKKKKDTLASKEDEKEMVEERLRELGYME